MAMFRWCEYRFPPHLMSFVIYRQLGSLGPCFLKRDTKMYLELKGSPAEYFANLTDAQMIAQSIVGMFVATASKNGY